MATVQNTQPGFGPGRASLLEDSQRRVSRRFGETAILGLLFFCAAVSVLTTIAIVVVLATETVLFFQEVTFAQFFLDTRWTPVFTTKHYGIWALVAGTVTTSAVALTVSLPLGLLSAIYLSEYAPQRLRAVIKPALEILAGVPTVVYGYFALTFVTPWLRTFVPGLQGFNALSPGLVMGVMILPLVASLSEDALQAVPMAMRQGAYALGATKFEVSTKVVVPAAISGIAASFILAMSRAVGETMIVAIAAGQRPQFTFDVRDQVQTMTGYIVQLSLGDVPTLSLDFKTLFAVGMMLFLMTLTLNVVSHFIVTRFREAY